MNRRDWMLLPGVAALLAGHGKAQSLGNRPGGTQTVSAKRALKYGRAKSSYRVPKNPAQTAKYVSFLGTLLTLTPDQQKQASTVFSDAATNRARLRTSLKNAHQALVAAVRGNDTFAIDQTSAAIGGLKAQLLAAGAKANLAFQQFLTPDQQTKLGVFQS